MVLREKASIGLLDSFIHSSDHVTPEHLQSFSPILPILHLLPSRDDVHELLLEAITQLWLIKANKQVNNNNNNKNTLHL